MAGKALIAGATGLVGGFLVRHLIASKLFDELIVVIRKGAKFHSDSVSVVEIDFDHMMDFKEIIKVDVVFCCLGTTMKKARTKDRFYQVDYIYPYELAKLSYNNGAKQFNIITASGASSRSFFYYNRVKGEIENAISQIGFESVNIFRPSLLLGKRNEKRIGEQAGAAVAKIINPFLRGAAKKYRAIQAETVAKAMIHVSQQAHKGVLVLQSDVIQEYGQL